ncbi:MAG: ATP-dependent helicase RecG, partial [Alphaproteobacteria bacterium]|nr:ATP-dependent helicase RecG [Alphaproteobacteria bacterium]
GSRLECELDCKRDLGFLHAILILSAGLSQRRRARSARLLLRVAPHAERLVFSNRVEIISPGRLPNNLTIANVKAGNSNIRNPILASFAAKLLPYRGLGSGVLRAIKAYPDIDLIDDREANLFRAA